MQSLLLGHRDFWPEQDIRGLVRESLIFDPAQENLDEAEAILIFKTSKQQTWLVITELRMYCILDDARKHRPSIQWALGKDDLIREGEVVAPIQTRDKSARTGLLDVGPRTGWLFSKSLFSEKALPEILISHLRTRMIEP